MYLCLCQHFINSISFVIHCGNGMSRGASSTQRVFFMHYFQRRCRQLVLFWGGTVYMSTCNAVVWDTLRHVVSYGPAKQNKGGWDYATMRLVHIVLLPRPANPVSMIPPPLQQGSSSRVASIEQPSAVEWSLLHFLPMASLGRDLSTPLALSSCLLHQVCRLVAFSFGAILPLVSTHVMLAPPCSRMINVYGMLVHVVYTWQSSTEFRRKFGPEN